MTVKVKIKYLLLFLQVAAMGASPRLLWAVEFQPGDQSREEAAYYRAEGRHFQESGDLKNAAEAYRKALAVHPHFAESYNDLGVVLESLGELSDAESAYQAAVRLDPRLAGAHSNLALLYERRGMIQEAAHHWGERVRLGPPQDPWAMKAREKLVQYQLAVPELPEAIARKNKLEAGFLYESGRAHMRAHRYPQAIADFEKALSLDPSHTRTQTRLEEARRKLTIQEASKEKALTDAKERARLAQEQEAKRWTAQEKQAKEEQAKKERMAQALKSAEEKQAREKAAMEKAAQERAAKEKAAQEKAAQEKAAQERMAKEMAAKRVVREEQVIEPLERQQVAEAQALAQALSQEKAKARGQGVRDLMQQAVTAMRLGRYPEAIQYFQQILLLEPKNSDAAQGLKRAKSAQEKVEQAAPR